MGYELRIKGPVLIPALFVFLIFFVMLPGILRCHCNDNGDDENSDHNKPSLNFTMYVNLMYRHDATRHQARPTVRNLIIAQ